jgi:hypothetical protein
MVFRSGQSLCFDAGSGDCGQAFRLIAGANASITVMLVEYQFNNIVFKLYFTVYLLVVINRCGPIGPVKGDQYGRKSRSTRLGRLRV